MEPEDYGEYYARQNIQKRNQFYQFFNHFLFPPTWASYLPEFSDKQFAHVVSFPLFNFFKELFFLNP